MTEMNPVGWFEIYVSDMERSKTFYEAVFNEKLNELANNDEMEMWAFRGDEKLYGATGALIKMNNVPAGNNSGVVIYFSCEDCKTEENRALSAGGKVERSKFSIGKEGFISLIRDIEGNLFGLHSRK